MLSQSALWFPISVASSQERIIQNLKEHLSYILSGCPHQNIQPHWKVLISTFCSYFLFVPSVLCFLFHAFSWINQAHSGVPFCLFYLLFSYTSWQIVNLVPVQGVIVWSLAAAAAKSLQLCPTLCNPIDGSPPGSPVPGILQARTLEWVAISFSNAWKWKVQMKSLSHVRLFATPWTAAHQAPPSMGFSRQEYWSGVPLPSPSMKP